MKNKDAVFMAKARLVATQGTCLRRKVGCVIVSRANHDHVSGYNGSLPKEPHCTDPGVGCLMRDGHCVRTVHAEANAIAQAARYGIRLKGATLYVTASPCLSCFQLALSAGIRRIVFGELYTDNLIYDIAIRRGIELADGRGLPLLGVTV